MVTHTWNLCSASNPSKVHTHGSEHRHNVHTHTHGAVGSNLCCGTRGAVGGSVPCSRAPQSWYWRWRVCCTLSTPPTITPLFICLLKIAIAQIAHTHMKLRFKIFGLTINALKYIVKDDKFVTKCYLDCDDAVKEKNIEKNKKYKYQYSSSLINSLVETLPKWY